MRIVDGCWAVLYLYVVHDVLLSQISGKSARVELYYLTLALGCGGMHGRVSCSHCQLTPHSLALRDVNRVFQAVASYHTFRVPHVTSACRYCPIRCVVMLIVTHIHCCIVSFTVPPPLSVIHTRVGVCTSIPTLPSHFISAHTGSSLDDMTSVLLVNPTLSTRSIAHPHTP